MKPRDSKLSISQMFVAMSVICLLVAIANISLPRVVHVIILQDLAIYLAMAVFVNLVGTEVGLSLCARSALGIIVVCLIVITNWVYLTRAKGYRITLDYQPFVGTLSAFGIVAIVNLLFNKLYIKVVTNDQDAPRKNE